MPTTHIESIGTGRDHTTINGWEAATDNDLVALDEIRIGETYSQTFTETVSLADAITDSTRYRILRAAAGQRYNPVTAAGSYVTDVTGLGIIQLREAFLQVSGLGVENTSTGASTTQHAMTFTGSSANTIVDGVWARIGAGGTGARYRFRSSSGSNHTVRNCIAVGQGSSSTTNHGFSMVRTGDKCQNCVAFGIAGGSGRGINNPNLVRNCISMDCNTDFAPTPTTASNNCSSDTTAPGANSLVSRVATDIFESPSTQDFHLKAGSAAIDAGFDLSGQFTTDFAGTTRAGLWDMGAYDAGGAGGPPAPTRRVVVTHGRATQADQTQPIPTGDQDFWPGDFSGAGLIIQGNGYSSLPGGWRPFAPSSFWNSPIPSGAFVHSNNTAMMAEVLASASNPRFRSSFLPAVWTVNSNNITGQFTRRLTAGGAGMVSWLDPDLDHIAEFRSPITSSATMWVDSSSDGHFVVIDPFKGLMWEFSKFEWEGAQGAHTTFNVWSVFSTATQNTSEFGLTLTAAQMGNGLGHYDSSTDTDARWFSRGARASGTPVIAGLVRPEQITAGIIRNKLAWTIDGDRSHQNFFMRPPGSRTDGDSVGNQFPRHGMVYRLNPAVATEAQFTTWGLSTAAKVVARAMRDYGVVQVDKGSTGALFIQRLDANNTTHRSKWDAAAPGLYDTIENIPLSDFQIMELSQDEVDETTF